MTGWSGTIAVEGERTVDGRLCDPDSLYWAQCLMVLDGEVSS